jgi:hypothetical protein
VIATPADAVIVIFSDPSGLSAEAEFTLLNATTLEVRLRNTSTGTPDGFDSSDQLLTGLSWDFGLLGSNPGDVEITGGSVIIGPSSASVNFDTGSYTAGDDVSGEYGYGNNDGTGAMLNFISGNTAQATPFGGANLDGPASIDGPQAGLVANPILVPLGGLGAIQNEIIATLTLSAPLLDLSFLDDNGAQVEFGSDAAFIFVPGPASAVLLMGAFALRGRRRRN